MKQAKETDPEKIEQCIAKGEYVAKELEVISFNQLNFIVQFIIFLHLLQALYSLKKYRTMKRRYYKED